MMRVMDRGSELALWGSVVIMAMPIVAVCIQGIYQRMRRLNR